MTWKVSQKGTIMFIRELLSHSQMSSLTQLSMQKNIMVHRSSEKCLRPNKLQKREEKGFSGEEEDNGKRILMTGSLEITAAAYAYLLKLVSRSQQFLLA